MRPWQRAATPYVQAVMVLEWFKERTDVPVLARDAAVGIATAYRFLHEAIDMIAAQAPELPEVLAQGPRAGWAFVCLDGTLIASTRSSARSETGHDVWYSGKHKRHGGNCADWEPLHPSDAMKERGLRSSCGPGGC